MNVAHIARRAAFHKTHAIERRMTEEEAGVLMFAAQDISFNVKKTIAELTFYGAYFVLVCMSLYTIIKRRQRTVRTWILFSILIITFCLTTLQCAVDISFVITEIQMVLIDKPEVSIIEKSIAFAELGWFRAAFIVVIIVTGVGDSGLVCLINDGLAAWRAISILQSSSQRYMRVILYTLLFFCSGLWVASTTLQIRAIGTPGPLTNSDPPSILAITGSSMSVLANAVATGVMGHSAYQQRRSNGPLRFQGPRVLALLTESGLFYLLIQIVRLGLIVSFVPSTPAFGSLETASTIFALTTMVLAAMYTPALILIIHRGYSVADTNNLQTLSSGSHPRSNSNSAGHSSRDTRSGDHWQTTSDIVFAPAKPVELSAFNKKGSQRQDYNFGS